MSLAQARKRTWAHWHKSARLHPHTAHRRGRCEPFTPHQKEGDDFDIREQACSWFRKAAGGASSPQFPRAVIRPIPQPPSTLVAILNHSLTMETLRLGNVK